MKYSVTCIESPEGWAVSCPALPGCHSQGATRVEALENIKDAIQLWLEVAEEDAAHAEEESGVTVSRAIGDRLEQLLEFFRRQPGVFGYGAHAKWVDRIAPWNNEPTVAIGHHDMAAFASNTESRFLQCTDCLLVRDSREFWHRLNRHSIYVRQITGVEQSTRSPQDVVRLRSCRKYCVSRASEPCCRSTWA